MPGKNHPFTTHVDPGSPPWRAVARRSRLKLVEAPGTAPGSATLITSDVYRHSRQADEMNIGIFAENERCELRRGGIVVGNDPLLGHVLINSETSYTSMV